MAKFAKIVSCEMMRKAAFCVSRVSDGMIIGYRRDKKGAQALAARLAKAYRKRVS